MKKMMKWLGPTLAAVAVLCGIGIVFAVGHATQGPDEVTNPDEAVVKPIEDVSVSEVAAEATKPVEEKQVHLPEEVIKESTRTTMLTDLGLGTPTSQTNFGWLVVVVPVAALGATLWMRRFDHR